MTPSKARSKTAAGEENAAMVTDALAKFFTLPTRILTYGPQTNSSKLVAARSLLYELLQVASNLSFSKLMVDKCLADVAEQKKEWQFTRNDKADFVKSQSERVRLMCRHLAQALVKGPRAPKWAKQIASNSESPMAQALKRGASQEETAEEDEEEEEDKERDDDVNAPLTSVAAATASGAVGAAAAAPLAGPADTPGAVVAAAAATSLAPASGEKDVQYWVGWDPERGDKGEAWRRRADQPKAPKEFTAKWVVPAMEPKTDVHTVSMLAEWSDGKREEIAAMSVVNTSGCTTC